MKVCKMSVEEKLRTFRGKRTLEILINSQRGKFSSEFCRKLGIRVECTVVHVNTNESVLPLYDKHFPKDERNIEKGDEIEVFWNC